MAWQQLIPWGFTLIAVLLFRPQLIGARSRWAAFPLALLTALAIAAIAGLIQFWIPQIQIGLGTKGLPLVVFGIVAWRAALPTLVTTIIVLLVLALIKFLKKAAVSDR